ncbi:MAG: SDR family oxidoreductase [Bacteroidales bacterium]|nr:SDR family oxidoreductase [Bacteroidales bacterium]MDD4670460.1 SDR family oxidoreductase [Bacteroidales bacterium]
MFENKIIIITGASSGIGLASAKLFASKGAKLVLAARSFDKLQLLEKEILSDKNIPDSTEILCVRTDVSVETDCRDMVEAAIRRFGKIDILINNAGVSMRAKFIDMDLSVIRRLMDVNFWGTVYCTKYALPYIIKEHGSVVGVISTAGYIGLPARTGYSSSKYAIRGFLDTLRVEHLKDHLHVLVFAPGFTASNVRKAALTADGTPQGETPLEEGRLMSAEEVARRMAKAIEHRKTKVILTSLAKLTLLLSKYFPRITDRLEYNYMAKEPDSPLK